MSSSLITSEFDKWEKEEDVKERIQQLVALMIAEEPEIDNLKEMDTSAPPKEEKPQILSTNQPEVEHITAKLDDTFLD